MAGNVFEVTTENCTNCETGDTAYRGRYHSLDGSALPAAYRDGQSGGVSNIRGFRPVIYKKR